MSGFRSAAREAARRQDGKFGTQEHGRPTRSLEEFHIAPEPPPDSSPETRASEEALRKNYCAKGLSAGRTVSISQRSWAVAALKVVDPQAEPEPSDAEVFSQLAGTARAKGYVVMTDENGSMAIQSAEGRKADRKASEDRKYDVETYVSPTLRSVALAPFKHPGAFGRRIRGRMAAGSAHNFTRFSE